VITGRTGRRGLYGTLHVQTSELVELVGERSRQDDGSAWLEALGQVRPEAAKRLIWDHTPPHHPKRG
jgi:hypothetical protein